MRLTSLRLAPVAITIGVLVALLAFPGAAPRIATAEAALSARFEAATVPPPGGISTTVTESREVMEFLATVPFEVTTLAIFDIGLQRWAIYSPASPAFANQTFLDAFRTGALVWVRRAERDTREGVSWGMPSTAAVREPSALGSPPPGGLVAGLAGTTSLARLIEAQPFRVASVLAFDVATQEYRWHTAEAPAFVNSLGDDSLTPGSVVWLQRDRSDTESPVDHLSRLASAIPVSVVLPGAALVPAPHISLLLDVTYEAGEVGLLGGQSGTARLGATTEAARSGTYAGFALLRPGDERWGGGGYRSEWHGNDHITGPGAERWHGISFYFPSDYDQGDNSTWDDRIIFQFADEGSPMFSLHLDADRQELWVRRKLPERNAEGNRFETLARWPFETNRWYDVAFHAIWTKDDTGRFEVYVDGARRVAYTGRTLAVRSVTYSKWGIYGQPTRLLFDDVRVAEGPDQLRAVSPR